MTIRSVIYPEFLEVGFGFVDEWLEDAMAC
jgi:hypothetical protein